MIKEYLILRKLGEDIAILELDEGCSSLGWYGSEEYSLQRTTEDKALEFKKKLEG